MVHGNNVQIQQIVESLEKIWNINMEHTHIILFVCVCVQIEGTHTHYIVCLCMCAANILMWCNPGTLCIVGIIIKT